MMMIMMMRMVMMEIGQTHPCLTARVRLPPQSWCTDTLTLRVWWICPFRAFKIQKLSAFSPLQLLLLTPGYFWEKQRCALHWKGGSRRCGAMITDLCWIIDDSPKAAICKIQTSQIVLFVFRSAAHCAQIYQQFYKGHSCTGRDAEYTGRTSVYIPEEQN